MLTNIATVSNAHQATKVERAAPHDAKALDQSQEQGQAQSWHVYISEKAQQLAAGIYYHAGNAADAASDFLHIKTQSVEEQIQALKRNFLLGGPDSPLEKLSQKIAELETRISQGEKSSNN